MAQKASSSVFTHIVWGTEPYVDYEAGFLALLKVGAFGVCASNDLLTTNVTWFSDMMG